ncbi:TPA: hypothetical protein ACPJ2A_003771 [Vibrio diabolicus]
MTFFVQIANFLWLLFVYLNPVDYWTKTNDNVIKNTENISEKAKVRLARLYLWFYLPVTFLAIWLTYTDMKSVVESLLNFDSNVCVKDATACVSNDLATFVVDNKFSINTFIEVSFLMVGVIVGNIGWDQSSEIRVAGFNKIINSMYYPTAILIISVLISVFLNDYVDLKSDAFYLPMSSIYRYGPWLIFMLAILGIHTFYYNKVEKKVN